MRIAEVVVTKPGSVIVISAVTMLVKNRISEELWVMEGRKIILEIIINRGNTCTGSCLL